MTQSSQIILTLGVLGVLLACAVYTIGKLLEVLRQPADAKFQSGSKGIWVAVILLTPLIGAVIYEAAGQPLPQGKKNASHPSKPESTREPEAAAVTGFELPARPAPAPSVSELPANPAPASGDSESKTCPDCAEEVRFAARVCRFCGYRFVEVDA